MSGKNGGPTTIAKDVNKVMRGAGRERGRKALAHLPVTWAEAEEDKE